MAKLTFYGGAKSVTGSNYLLEHEGVKILIDCGLAQGSQLAEEFNYQKFPYDPKEINYVLVTHSHADHIGRLPKLYKEGFRGKLICTEPTLEIIKVALPDNMVLMAEEAMGHGHESLWDENDLAGILDLADPVNYEVEKNLEGLNVIFHDAGHILGSSIIEINFGDKKIFFSGDLGNPPTPLLNYPYIPKAADYIVIESAYGGRIHEDRATRKDILLNAIISTISNGGTVMIPSFAIERTQELLYELNNLMNEKKISPVPIFVDSPLAIKITAVYKKFPEYFNRNTNYIIQSGDDIFNFPGLKFTETVQESKAINDVIGPKIIIAGSGMSNGGRILHHERRYLSDPNSMIIFVGYQVKGSLGRKILEGDKVVKVLGDSVEVNCKVVAVGGYSAHADQNMLTDWVVKASKDGKLKNVFTVQGEEEAATALAEKIKSVADIKVTIPEENQFFDL